MLRQNFKLLLSSLFYFTFLFPVNWSANEKGWLAGWLELVNVQFHGSTSSSHSFYEWSSMDRFLGRVCEFCFGGKG